MTSRLALVRRPSAVIIATAAWRSRPVRGTRVARAELRSRLRPSRLVFRERPVKRLAELVERGGYYGSASAARPS
ncbi:MAG: hypothetical protein ACHQQR_08195, partial [Gemmatimonadales bacterium]